MAAQCQVCVNCPFKASQSSRLLLLLSNYQVAIPTSFLFGLCSLYGVMGVAWYIALHSSQYMTINLPYCPLICPKICWKGVIKIEIVGGEHLKRQVCTKWWREEPGEGGWACVARGVPWGRGGGRTEGTQPGIRLVGQEFPSSSKTEE